MRKVFRWPTLIVLAVLLLAALVPAVLSISHAAHASGNATIKLSAPIGQPGATISVSGQGFAASQPLSLYLGGPTGTLLATATTDASGNLPSTTVTVPDKLASSYGITAVQGNIRATAAFSIVPLISLPQTAAYPGEAVTVTVRGFEPNEAVQLFFDTISGQTSLYFYANASGDASIPFTIPSGYLVGGHHVLIAVGNGSGAPLIAQVGINIQPHIYQMAGQSGIKNTLYGVGFVANEAVNIYWGKATGQLLGPATAGPWGYLNFTFTVPTGLSVGLYPVTVVRTNHFPLHVVTLFSIKPLLLTITPGGIHSGQQVQAHLSGFLANEGVTLSWNANGGQQLTQAQTNAQGQATATFTPNNTGPGSYTVTASDSQGLQATSTLSIGPGISLAFGNNYLFNTPGGTITINGGGFAANETVNVYLQTPATGEVTTTTGTAGVFTVNMTLPNTYNPTTHYILYAVSTTGTDHATIPFEFLPPTLQACNDADTSCNGEEPYGQIVGFIGNNFGPDETVDIIWNYQQPGQFTLAKGQCFFGDDFSTGKLVPSVPGQGTVTIAAIGETSHLIATTTLIVDPAIYDNVDRASAGTSINVNGGGFGAGDAITLTLAGQTVGTLNSQSDGTFATSFKMPAINGAGNLTLTATDTTTNIALSLTVYYIPTIVVSPTVVQNGDTITVTGKHFSANAQIQVYYGNTQYFLANANGSFSATVIISGLQPGSYNFAVSDMTSFIQVSVPIVVQ
ncbi:MAG TPA: Ig-like domain-containing protein [Ktedonobacteraceae bacterium]|nr:Ig-like domain-containing protein [Ktedonobacteraceae bacterium]